MSRHGRVLNASAESLVLYDAGRVAQFSPPPAGSADLRPGDLVEVTDGGVRRLHAHASGDYPQAGSDGVRFDTTRWATLQRRAVLTEATRAFFRARGMLEVETPLLVAAPGTEVHLDPVPASLRARHGADPAPRWLITSPECHMKRLLAAGAPALFQIARVFRDGEFGARHRPEFTMLEWYRPWADYTALMHDCEGWFGALAGGRWLTWQSRRYDLAPPWPRIAFFDALRDRAGVTDPERLSPDAQLQALVDAVEPTLGAQRPEFLVDYPIEMASLARRSPSNPRVAERFELYVGGLELANGFGELTDAAEQRARCEAENAERATLGKPQLPLDAPFLAALAEGMPPSAGIAAGLDRVMMLFCDAADIDAVIAF